MGKGVAASTQAVILKTRYLSLLKGERRDPVSYPLPDCTCLRFVPQVQIDIECL